MLNINCFSLNLSPVGELEPLDFTLLLKSDDEKISGDECCPYINDYHHWQIVSAVAKCN